MNHPIAPRFPGRHHCNPAKSAAWSRWTRRCWPGIFLAALLGCASTPRPAPPGAAPPQPPMPPRLPPPRAAATKINATAAPLVTSRKVSWHRPASRSKTLAPSGPLLAFLEIGPDDFHPARQHVRMEVDNMTPGHTYRLQYTVNGQTWGDVGQVPAPDFTAAAPGDVWGPQFDLWPPLPPELDGHALFRVKDITP